MMLPRKAMVSIIYTTFDFKTKKAIKEALKAGHELITVFQPNNMFDVKVPANGTVFIEGPHYPKPHTWYAKGTMKDGYLIKIT